MEAAADLDGVTEGATEFDGVTDRVTEFDGVTDRVTEFDGVTELATELDDVTEGVADLDGDSDTDAVTDGDTDTEAVVDGDSETLGDTESESETLGETLGDNETLRATDDDTDGVGVMVAVTSETATVGARLTVASACVHAPPPLQLNAVIAVERPVAPGEYTLAVSRPEIVVPQAPPAKSAHVVVNMMTVLPPQSTGAPTLPPVCRPRRRAEQVTGWPTMVARAEVTLELAGCGQVVPSGCARGERAAVGATRRGAARRGAARFLPH